MSDDGMEGLTLEQRRERIAQAEPVFREVRLALKHIADELRSVRATPETADTLRRALQDVLDLEQAIR